MLPLFEFDFDNAVKAFLSEKENSLKLDFTNEYEARHLSLQSCKSTAHFRTQRSQQKSRNPILCVSAFSLWLVTF